MSALDETGINVVFIKQMSVFNFIYQENDAGIIQHSDIIKVLPTTIIKGHNIVIFLDSVMWNWTLSHTRSAKLYFVKNWKIKKHLKLLLIWVSQSFSKCQKFFQPISCI